MDYRKYFMDNIEGLQKLISIPSTYDEKTADHDKPYGKPVHDALTYMKQVLQSDGFEVTDLENKIIFATVGEGERIDILSHLDVVSVNGEWQKDPFSGDIEDGYLYGRGSQDMKTPAWLVYLAVRMIRDSGNKLNKEIRLVYGSDEERMMDDMKLYVSKVEPASFSFTPDGRFPVAIGEKGIMTVFMKGRYDGLVSELTSGSQSTTVPSEARCLVKEVSEQAAAVCLLADEMNGRVRKLKGGLKIETFGVAAHSSHPEKGHSALIDLLKLLGDVCRDESLKKLHEAFHDYHGKGLGIACDSKEMGSLTVNLGALNIKNGEVSGKVDIRYPMGADPERIMEQLKRHLPDHEFELVYEAPASLVREDDHHVQALLDIYNKVMNADEKPFISDSGSYAKVVGNCVSMGPVFPDQESGFHQMNERISLDDCVKCLEIYHKAILKLLDLGYSIDS